MDSAQSEMFDLGISGMAEVVIEAADDAVVIATASGPHDAALTIVYANDAYLAMRGFTREEVIGRAPLELAQGLIQPEMIAVIADGLASQQPFREEVMALRGDGSHIWIDFSVRPLRNAQGDITHWVCVQRDITRHKTAIAELARRTHELEEIQSLAKIGSWRWEVGAEGIVCSAEACAMVGLPRRQSFVPFAALAQVTDAKDFRTIRSTLQNTAALGKSQTIEYPITTVDPGTRTIWARTYPEFGGDGRVVAVSGLNQDMTDRLRIEQSLRWNATHDRLTGLINMTALHERAPTVFASASADSAQVVLAVIDLDHLKLVNDTLGHAVGDGLIREAADRLLERLGARGHIARLGGDEFVFLGTWKGPSEQLAEYFDKVGRHLKQPFDYQGRQLDCSASIGVVLAAPQQAGIDTLMRVLLLFEQYAGGGRSPPGAARSGQAGRVEQAGGAVFPAAIFARAPAGDRFRGADAAQGG